MVENTNLMFCTIYMPPADPAIGRFRMRDLLERARGFDRANDITGLLLCYGHESVRYPEGNEFPAAKLFGKIKTDRGRTEAVLLYS